MLTDHQKEFLLQEHESLRREIESTLQEQLTLERYVLVSVGALTGWILTHKVAQSYSNLAWAISPIVVAFAALRALIIGGIFGDISAYMRRIETAFDLPREVGGWEHYRYLQRHPPNKKRNLVVMAKGLQKTAFWILLLGITLALAKWHPEPQEQVLPGRPRLRVVVRV